MKDCLCFAATIENYVGQNCSKALHSMRQVANLMADEDIKYNISKLFEVLDDIALQTHFNAKQPKEFYNPSPREMILFTMSLFMNLPHYIPQSAPIVFTCILGQTVVKSIELNNPTGKVLSYWVDLLSSSLLFGLGKI